MNKKLITIVAVVLITITSAFSQSNKELFKSRNYVTADGRTAVVVLSEGIVPSDGWVQSSEFTTHIVDEYKTFTGSWRKELTNMTSNLYDEYIDLYENNQYLMERLEGVMTTNGISWSEVRTGFREIDFCIRFEDNETYILHVSQTFYNGQVTNGGFFVITGVMQ